MQGNIFKGSGDYNADIFGGPLLCLPHIHEPRLSRLQSYVTQEKTSHLYLRHMVSFI